MSVLSPEGARCPLLGHVTGSRPEPEYELARVLAAEQGASMPGHISILPGTVSSTLSSRIVILRDLAGDRVMSLLDGPH
jgi:hypothetical protein